MASPDLLHTASYGGRSNGSAYGNLFRNAPTTDHLSFSKNSMPAKTHNDYKYTTVAGGDIKQFSATNSAWSEAPKSTSVSKMYEPTRLLSTGDADSATAAAAVRNGGTFLSSDRLAFTPSSFQTGTVPLDLSSLANGNRGSDNASSSLSPRGTERPHTGDFQPLSTPYMQGYERLLSSVTSVPKTLDSLSDKSNDINGDSTLTKYTDKWNLPRRSDHTNYNTHQKYLLGDAFTGSSALASAANSLGPTKSTPHSEAWDTPLSSPFKDTFKSTSALPPSTDYVSKWQEKKTLTSPTSSANWMSLNRGRSFELYSSSSETAATSTVSPSIQPSSSSSYQNNSLKTADYSGVGYHTPSPPKAPNPHKTSDILERGASSFSLLPSRNNDKTSDISDRSASIHNLYTSRLDNTLDRSAANSSTHHTRTSENTSEQPEKTNTPYSVLPSRVNDYTSYLEHALSKPATPITTLDAATAGRYGPSRDTVNYSKEILPTTETGASGHLSEASTRSLNAHIDDLILGHTFKISSTISSGKPILKKKSSYDSTDSFDRASHRSFLKGFQTNEIPSFPARGTMGVVQKRLPPLSGSAGSLRGNGKRVTFNMSQNTNHWYEAAVYDEPYNLAYLY